MRTLLPFPKLLPRSSAVGRSEVRTERQGAGWITVVWGGPLDGQEWASATEREALELHRRAVMLAREERDE